MRTAPLRFNRILINGAFFHSLDEGDPDFTISNLFHAIHARVPLVKVADDAYALRVWCPNGKAHAPHTVFYDRMRTEHFIGVVIRSLMKKI